MALARRITRYIPTLIFIALAVGMPVEPFPSPDPQGGPWILYGTISTGDGTSPDFPQSGSVDCVAFPGGGHVYNSGAITSGGSYQTMRALGTGAYGTCAAYASGYFSGSTDYSPISSDAVVNFTIYSVKAWLSGSLSDAVSGAAVANPSVTAFAGGGTSYASFSGSTYNFGGTTGHPLAGGGLGVSRPGNVNNGPGSTTYQVTAQASNYFSESRSVALTSGQVATQPFALYPVKGNIKGKVYDGSTGQLLASANVYAVEANQYASISGGSYTFAGSAHPDWGLSVTQTGGSGPGSKTYTITASWSGYTDYVSPPITVVSGQSSALDIYLYPSAGNIDLGPCNRSGCEHLAGRPINLSNGNVWIQQRDYTSPGLGGGLELVRTWNSLWNNVNPIALLGMFGHSWRANYEERLNFPRSDTLKYWRGDGSAWIFHYDTTNRIYSLVAPPNERGSLTYDSGTTKYTMTFPDGSQKIFNNGGYLTAIIDRNGNQATISYDGSNRITQVADAAGRTIIFTYGDPSHSAQVTSVRDSVGTFTQYSYDSTGRLAQVTYADNSFVTFTYDTSNQIVSVKDTNAKILESHTYDGLRRGLTSQRANGVDAVTVSYPTSGTTQVVDSLANSTTYLHGELGGRQFVFSITGSGCASCGGRGTSTFGYDSKGNRTSSTDALGRSTTYSYDLMGNVTSRTVQLVPGTNYTWTYTYNGLAQVLTATDPLGNTTTNTYDAKGNLLSTTAPSPDGIQAGSTTSFAYDIKGQLIQVTDPRGNATNLAYTAAGLIASITDAGSNATSNIYDGRGNRTSVTDALSNATTFTYDTMNRLTGVTQPGSITASFAYDNRGRRTSVTDANGKVTSYAYDDEDRLISVTDAQGNITRYAYDTENNLTSITDTLTRVTSFTYDAYGRVTRATFPSTLIETYTYDAVGNLLTKTDRKTQTISYTYDALNRLTLKQYPNSTSVAYTYDALSRLTQVADPTGTYQFAYDNMGRLKQTTTNYAFLTGRSFVVSYAYDAASNRTALTDPESGSTNYTYDTLNRLTGLTNFQAQQFTFSYDALSRRTQLARPNGVNTSYQYDNLSRLLAVLHQLAGSTIDGATYAVDAVGNRTAKTNQLAGVTSNYSYDAIYQLTQAAQGASTTESYGYDAVGNRLSSLGVSPYAYNSSNQLTSTPGATYTYDNNGNTLTKTDATGTTNYAWDFENRLASVTLPGGAVVTFKYDPFGRRIYKSSSSATSVFAYDGDNSVEETDGSGAVVARYTQGLGIDEPLAILRGGATSYYQADGLGSVTSLTNTSGAVAASYTYDSFGNLTTSTGTLVNSLRYTARESDTETGLYYYRARYYDPSSGRFLSEDPIGFDGGPNFYEYVYNDPSSFTDPMGLQGTQPVPTPKPIPPPPVTSPAPPITRPTPIQPSPEPSPGPSTGSGIPIIGPVLGAIGLILGSPMDLSPGENDWLKRRDDDCRRKGKWHCIAKCHIKNFGNQPNIPDFVFGEGWGSSMSEAMLAAEKDANTYVPRGTHKRHCTFKCQQR